MKLLKAIWCLPQLLLGAAVKLITGAVKDERGLYIWKFNYGLSLDQFIFVNKNASEDTIKHEYGHTKQSKILGPLYLLVVGLPSAIWCHCFESYRQKYNKSYYDFYCEKWADKLGGVVRQ